MTSTIESEPGMSKLGLDKRYHVILEYTRKKIQQSTSGQYITGPRLNGMSGCGIWIVPSVATAGDFSDLNFYPTAILTEYEPKTHCVVGTRIRVVTEILRQQFNLPIQKSSLINLNFSGQRIERSSLPLRGPQ